MTFDPTAQTRMDGALTQSLRDRLIAAKEKHRLSFHRLAGPTRISGSFLSNVSRGENVATKWVKNIVSVVEFLEACNPHDPQVDQFLSSSTTTSSVRTLVDHDSLEHAFNILKKNGVLTITMNL